jgi:hypothetical protein
LACRAIDINKSCEQEKTHGASSFAITHRKMNIGGASLLSNNLKVHFDPKEITLIKYNTPPIVVFACTQLRNYSIIGDLQIKSPQSLYLYIS